MEQLNLFEQKEDKNEYKPSFFQRARDYLKNKWVNAAGLVVIGSALTIGGAPGLKAQEIEQVPQPRVEFNYNNTQQNASFIGVTAGDHDMSRNLDFILEDYSLADKNNNPFMLWVHEDYDWTNKQVLDEVKNRINNPDQYPFIEAIGTYRPVQPYGRWDGRLDLEAIITRDNEGNEEVFYTDSSNSNFYYISDNYFFDWAFFPGRHLTGFYYPHFTGFYPHWDYDGDGIPNIFDRSPFHWDPWNSFMFDPFYNMNYWRTPGWFGWNYWNYWGGPDYYVNINIINDHHGNPMNWNKYLTTITRNQLKDPNRAPDAIDTMKQLKANIESHRTVLTNEQLQQRDRFVNSVEKQNYEGLLKNPQIKTKDQDGKEKIIKVNPRDFNPDNYGRITQRGEGGRPDRVVTAPNDRIRSMVNPDYSGSIERNTERNIERNTGEGRSIERNVERNTERNADKNPPKPPVIRNPPKTSSGETIKKQGSTTSTIKKKHEPTYSSSSTIRNYESTMTGRTENSPRSTTNYPSRLQGDITDRLRAPRDNKRYNLSTPNRSTYTPSSTNRSIRPSTTYTTPRTYSAPRSSGSTGTYKPTIRSSPSSSRSSGSYRAPSSTRSSRSSYRPSTTSRSSGSSRSSSSRSSGSVKKK
ncbi:hypothetical protein JXB28_02185 [Candidatus Woesearchaeota archaeon]|nr:hypothetical protein [Candidatus Woesearchaeota archaeon]